MTAVPATIKGRKDFLAGLIFLATGVIIVVWAQRYQMGTATRMGPGYFPTLLGILLCLIGFAAAVKGILTKTPDPLASHSPVPLLAIAAAIVSFGVLIERAGFIAASLVCLALACYQRLFTRPLEVLAIFVALTSFNCLVFIYLLEVPMRMF